VKRFNISILDSILDSIGLQEILYSIVVSAIEHQLPVAMEKAA
jgi:hypothetical protein